MASLKRFNSDKHEKYCSSNGQHMSAYVSASNTSKCSAKFCQVQPAGRDIGHWWRRHVTKYPCRAWRSHFCLPWTSTGAAEAIRSNCRNNELRPRQSSLSAFFSQIISLSHFISFHLAPTNNKNRFLSASYPLPIPNAWDRFHPIPHPEVQPTHWWGSAARLHCLPKLKKLWVWVGLNWFECDHLPFVNWVNWVKSACLPVLVWPLRQAEKRGTAADFANAKPHTSYYWDRWWNAMGSLKWWGTTAHVNLG